MSLLALTAFALAAPAAKLPPLHTKGNQILDDKNRPVRLNGVNVACMEWSSDGEGHMLKTVEVAVKEWKSNIVRLPMSQDRWFGHGPEQKDGGKSYRELVKKAVDYCAANGAYIMLDLHWNNVGEWGKNIGQHQMPDMYSVDFWKEVGALYKNNPAVIYDLYNETHDITWYVWLNGGEVNETRGPGARQGAFKPVKYKTPGMQKLLDVIRATGARNLIVAGGLDWAYDLSGFLKGYTLTDTKDGQGVVYACHAYPIKGDTIDQHLAKLDKALPHVPVILSEFGANNPRATADKPNAWVERCLAEWEKRNCNWVAWDLHPAAGPTLISGWDYKPTPSFGSLVKDHLAKGAAKR